jgi:hypothetical protein
MHDPEIAPSVTRLRRSAMLLALLSTPVVGLHAAALEEALAQCPGMARYMDEIAAKQAPSVAAPKATLPELREQILAMERENQAARKQQIEAGDSSEAKDRVRQIDQRHLSKLKTLAAERGFPNAAEIGKDGIDAFWLLVQHADADHAFQEEMLRVVTPRAKSDEIDGSKFALMTDRVLVAQGKPQRYGTQVRRDDGRFRVREVEDEPQLDARRRDAGLMPINDYLCMLGVLYTSTTKK